MSDERPLEFLKLITGEQIVGKVETPNATVIRVHQPLSFETGAADGTDITRRYVYMSRYVPFLQEQIIDIELQKVIFHGTPTDSIARYYTASLAFCERHTDVDFESCLNETSEQMEETVREIDMENTIMNAPNKGKDSKEITEQVFQNLLLAALPTANSVH